MVTQSALYFFSFVLLTLLLYLVAWVFFLQRPKDCIAGLSLTMDSNAFDSREQCFQGTAYLACSVGCCGGYIHGNRAIFRSPPRLKPFNTSITSES